MPTICFATNNDHKRTEVQALLGSDFTIVGLKEIGCEEELAEDQSTLEGNSLQKAAYVFDRYKVPCFADDTGLEVDALGGKPGVYSARYAGIQRNSEDNMNLLLVNLSKIDKRNAQFRTVITLITQHGKNQFEGILKGTILAEKRGVGGFGYDPIFVPEGETKTLAEMTLSEKNSLSHRARAVEKLVLYLKNLNN
ncbi:MAG: RdgB/HAM1 family non-canonical purine NTP pyrophosphatase [Cyclobacteriaceae bacterium]|nr:RdgB/HAM1 family non-canonical purine NTP pyrophosphatase [Cyclobacteriaceae bacterium]